MIESKCKMISNCLLLLLLYEINIDEMLFLMLVYFMIFKLILFVINLKVKFS